MATIALLSEGGPDRDYAASYAWLFLSPGCEAAREIRTSCDIRAANGRILSQGDAIEVEIRLINEQDLQPFTRGGLSFRLFESAGLGAHGKWH